MNGATMFSTHFIPKIIADKELQRLIKTYLKREWPDKDAVHDIKFDGLLKGSFYVQHNKFELEIDQPKIDFTVYAEDPQTDSGALGEKFRTTMNIVFEKYVS